MSDMDIFKCHCNWHHGMGPNIQCPTHGSRKNLFAGVLSRRREIARLEEEVATLKTKLHTQDWDVTCLRKLLTNVEKMVESRVIKAMIKLGLEVKGET